MRRHNAARAGLEPKEFLDVLLASHSALEAQLRRSGASRDDARLEAAVETAAAVLRTYAGAGGSAASGPGQVNSKLWDLPLVGKWPSRDVAAAALSTLFERALGIHRRRNQGAVYTPADVVDFMVREAIAWWLGSQTDVPRAELIEYWAGRRKLADSEAKVVAEALTRLRVLDPAAGVGAFLLGTVQAVCDLASRLVRDGGTSARPLRDPAHVLVRSCAGFEIDPDTALVSSYVLAVACGLPDAARVPVTVRNPLLEGMVAPDGVPSDVILMNPPYVGQKFLRERLGQAGRDALITADGFCGDLLVHFVLRAVRTLTPGGVISAIVSDTALTMDSATRMREALLAEVELVALSWCRPFENVAVRGGIVTAARRTAPTTGSVECLNAAARQSLDDANRVDVSRAQYQVLPHRPLFPPVDGAEILLERWQRVPDLRDAWAHAGARTSPAAPREVAELGPGAWTLLGLLVDSGQGLATGDDRRFVAAIDGTHEADLARQRQRRIIDQLRTDPAFSTEWDFAKQSLRQGHTYEEALLELLDRRDAGEVQDLPERKPFRTISPDDVHGGPVSSDEARLGIRRRRCWVPYETADRSTRGGGSRWLRENPVAIDWSCAAVTLLRKRQREGPRRPVLRNERLWFSEGVTHNRVASHFRARLLRTNSIFSSESPVYKPVVPWLSPEALLALMNSEVVEFALKTFLATRNHFELGHVRRVPIPVPIHDQAAALHDLGSQAITLRREMLRAGRLTDNELATIERTISVLVRDLYEIPRRSRLLVNH